MTYKNRGAGWLRGFFVWFVGLESDDGANQAQASSFLSP